MLYGDLLRLTVLLAAGAATLLAGVTIVSANQADDTTTLIVAAAWWSITAIGGLYLGRGPRATEAVRALLAGARTTPTLPTDNPGRVALSRLWPIGAFTVIAGGLGFVFPGVAAVGTGYALFVALDWRRRESAVEAVEERDGIRFYVEPGSALQPLTLIRTPGLRRDRAPAGHPPPPPPGATA
jgi:hypothetical protein